MVLSPSPDGMVNNRSVKKGSQSVQFSPSKLNATWSIPEKSSYAFRFRSTVVEFVTFAPLLIKMDVEKGLFESKMIVSYTA